MATEDSASWYARKLAQLRGSGQPFQGRAPISGYQQPQPGYQQNPPRFPQSSPSSPRPPPETLTELLDLQQHGQALRPGRGARLNPDPCPNCGGNLYYADLGLKRRGPPPAPHCFNCGYNELFEQGLESNWQGGA
jgi:hypothetical protein